MTTTSAFRLYKGYPSVYSLGLATTSIADPVPDVIDFLADGLQLTQTGGATNWIPTIPANKNGIWAESETQEGRTLLNQQVQNAVETFELVCSSRAVGYAALSKLLLWGQLARDFWASTNQDPLYLEWQAVGAPGSQWALIYTLEASVVEMESIREDGTTEPMRLSVSIEREIAWRGIPPGTSPKLWQLIANGLQPTTSLSPTTSQYNYTHLALSTNYSVPYRATVFRIITTGDQLGLAAENYLDVPAASIPGDAPALVAVSGLAGIGVMTTNRVYIAKTTRRDLYPNNNTAGSLSTSRARMSLNAGDAGIASPTNVTVTKQIVADGYLSNGSLVNRYVVRAVFAAGAAGFTNSLVWFIRYSQFGGRYALFMRATATVAPANAVSVVVSVNLPGGSAFFTDPVTLDNTTLGYRGGLTYLGEVNLPQSRYVDIDGTGVNDSQELAMALIFNKPSASTPTLEIWELVMLPIDEGVVELSRPGNGNLQYFNYDTSGYLGGVREVSGNYSDANAINAVLGNEIALTPNIKNRLYVLTNNTTGTFSPTTAFEYYVHVVPRWFGVRSV